MKFPTYKELGEIAAKEALDTFEYKGKTLREWIEIISSAELGTNLAEVGTDLISRQAAKDIFTELYGISAIGSVFDKYEWADICETTANELPSAEPDIIRCKDCAYCDSDVVDAPYGMTKKIFWCDRLYAGANENLIVEPDNFCSWAERRENVTD